MSSAREFAEAECGIRQLHARYCDAVWRLDFETFADCFAENCEWHIDGTILKGREEIVAYNRMLFAKFRRLMITLRTPALDLHADGTASGRTYFSGQNVLADGSAFAPLGVYHERFVRQGECWRLSWRLFQSLYAGPGDLSGIFHEAPDYGPPPSMPPRDAPTVHVSGRLGQD